MDKYVIKITRKVPESWGYEDKEEIHYYHGESVAGNKKAYNTRRRLMEVNRFTKQETKKNIKEIERIYETSNINGILIKIEVLDSETLKFVDINEPIRKVSRFELMEI